MSTVPGLRNPDQNLTKIERILKINLVLHGLHKSALVLHNHHFSKVTLTYSSFLARENPLIEWKIILALRSHENRPQTLGTAHFMGTKFLQGSPAPWRHLSVTVASLVVSLVSQDCSHSWWWFQFWLLSFQGPPHPAPARNDTDSMESEEVTQKYQRQGGRRRKVALCLFKYAHFPLRELSVSPNEHLRNLDKWKGEKKKHFPHLSRRLSLKRIEWKL